MATLRNPNDPLKKNIPRAVGGNLDAISQRATEAARAFDNQQLRRGAAPQQPTQPRVTATPRQPPQPATPEEIKQMNARAEAARKTHPTKMDDPIEHTEKRGRFAERAKQTASSASRLGKGAGKLWMGAAGLRALYQAADEGNTERFAERFGVAPPTGDGSVGDFAKFAALHAGGFASNLGDNILGNTIGNRLFRDRQLRLQPSAPQPSAPQNFVPQTETYVPPTVTPTITPGVAPVTTPPPPPPFRIHAERQPDGTLSLSGAGTPGQPTYGVEYVGPARNEMLRRGGTLSVLPASTSISPALDQQLSDARRAAAERGNFGVEQRTVAQEAMDAVQQMQARGLRVTGQTFRALAQDINQRRIAAAQDASRLRSDAARDETTRRGQDMELERVREARRAETSSQQRLREAQASIWEHARQNPIDAANLAMAAGIDPQPFLEMAKRTQGIDTAAAQNAERGLESLMRPDPDGKIPDSERARVRSAVLSVAPNYFTMSERERNEIQPDVTSAVRLLQGLNDTRNQRFLQYLGFVGDDPAITVVPAFGEGAKLERLGYFGGVLRPGVEGFDYVVRMRNGQRVYIPEDAVDQNMMNFLAKRGVDVSQVSR